MRGKVKQRYDWRQNVLIPEGLGSREKKVRSMRWPLDLAKRVAVIAEASNNDFHTAALMLLKWACDEHDAREEAAKKPAKKTSA